MRKNIWIILIAFVVILFIASLNIDGGLLKGQLNIDQPTGNLPQSSEPGLPPDFSAALEISVPDEASADILANVTIKNEGAGPTIAGQSFDYKIFVNDTEVFSNTDDYSTYQPGEYFSFSYPIPRQIYQYGTTGTVRVEVDSTNTVVESNENNNIATKEYAL